MFALNLNNTKGEYMKLQNLTVIFIIIIIPIILLVSLYITTGLKTLKYQSLYDTGLLTATHDAIFAFEQNTSNNEYSNNPEIKRDILKSSIKMFEKSLANTCGISSYNVEEIEEYIPAIVFGMYDGFYMYAPSKELVGDNKYEYKHNLKNYVYYSETLDDGTVIRYSLDNYVVVTGIFKDENGNDVYQTKGGYLAVGSSNDGKTYQGVTIVEETGLGEHSKDGINYYKESHEFTNWFLNTAKIGEKADYLKIGEEVNGYVNDPEDDNSAFVQHKRSIMKSKIEGVLNSSITAYSNRIWDKVYKMPKLSEEDWQKIYSNISMITFFQGKNIGLTKYNGYCVLNSTNSREYVNPNLMYFIEDDYYHDIRCTQLSTQASGYRIGKYEKIKVEQIDENGVTKVDDNGNVLYKYVYEHNKLACYDCINGPLQNNISLYDYVRNNDTEDDIKSSYFTSLGRERYNGSKPITYIPTQSEPETGDEEEKLSITIQKEWDDDNNAKNTRPNSIKVKIIGGEDSEVTLKASEDWKKTIELPKYDDANNEIHYTFEEIDVSNKYRSTVGGTGNTVKITNSLIRTTNVNVQKIWEDNDNARNTRPANVTVKLFANGIVKETVQLSESNGWKKTWGNLLKYDGNEEIVYEVKEVNIPDDYNSVVNVTSDNNGDTYKITNTLIETVSVTVEKRWDDNNNAKGKRPASVAVKLLANGTAKETFQLSASNSWKKTLNLPRFNGNELITYSVQEIGTVAGYESPTYTTEGNKLIITNKYESITIEDCNITLTVYDKLGLWYELETDWTARDEIKIEASVNKNIPIKLTVNGIEYTENDSSITREFSEGNKFTIVASVEIDGQVKTATRVIYKGEKNEDALKNVKKGNIYNGDNPFNKKGPLCIYIDDDNYKSLKYIAISSSDVQRIGNVQFTKGEIYIVGDY